MCMLRRCFVKRFTLKQSGREFEIIAQGSCRLVQVQFYHADTYESRTDGLAYGRTDGYRYHTFSLLSRKI